jgi:hypothetical protein
MATRNKERGRIRNSGMGGFLNPPGHPEHNYSVEVGRRNNPHSIMSLTVATEANWLNDATRSNARGLLESWKPLPIGHPQVAAWIRNVLGYYRNCYRNPNLPEPQCWYGSDVLIDRDRNPLETPEDHCGVHFIRKYYPGYWPSRDDFDSQKGA